jgi:hypothetical protein
VKFLKKNSHIIFAILGAVIIIGFSSLNLNPAAMPDVPVGQDIISYCDYGATRYLNQDDLYKLDHPWWHYAPPQAMIFAPCANLPKKEFGFFIGVMDAIIYVISVFFVRSRIKDYTGVEILPVLWVLFLHSDPAGNGVFANIGPMLQPLGFALTIWAVTRKKYLLGGAVFGLVLTEYSQTKIYLIFGSIAFLVFDTLLMHRKDGLKKIGIFFTSFLSITLLSYVLLAWRTTPAYALDQAIKYVKFLTIEHGNLPFVGPGEQTYNHSIYQTVYRVFGVNHPLGTVLGVGIPILLMAVIVWLAYGEWKKGESTGDHVLLLTFMVILWSATPLYYIPDLIMSGPIWAYLYITRPGLRKWVNWVLIYILNWVVSAAAKSANIPPLVIGLNYPITLIGLFILFAGCVAALKVQPAEVKDERPRSQLILATAGD